MKYYKILTEERLNTQYALENRNLYDEDCIHQMKAVAEELLLRSSQNDESLYDEICRYLQRLNNSQSKVKFLKKSGRLDEKKFYDYAQIDKNTWSNIRNDAKGILKESALKLVIALQLNEKEAAALLKKASWSFNKNDYRDRMIIALLHIKCYDPFEAACLLEEYGKNEEHPFKNIYNMDKFSPGQGIQNEGKDV